MLQWLSCPVVRLRRDRREVSALEHGILPLVVASVIVVPLGDPLNGVLSRFFNTLFTTLNNRFDAVQ